MNLLWRIEPIWLIGRFSVVYWWTSLPFLIGWAGYNTSASQDTASMYVQRKRAMLYSITRRRLWQ